MSILLISTGKSPLSSFWMPPHLCSRAVPRSCEFLGEETALLFQVCTLPNTAGPRFTALRCCRYNCKQQQTQPISAPAHLHLDWAHSWRVCPDLILQESWGKSHVSSAEMRSLSSLPISPQQQTPAAPHQLKTRCAPGLMPVGNYYVSVK